MGKRLFFHVMAWALVFFCPVASAQGPESRAQSPRPTHDSNLAAASLEVRLRLPGNVPFSGEASVRILDAQGAEIASQDSGDEGEAVFNPLPAERLVLEVEAPGFESLRQALDWDAHGDRVVFLPMKPDVSGAEGQESSAGLENEAEKTAALWIPPDVDDRIPPIEAGVACSTAGVLRGSGARIKRFAANLQKFSATEEVDHYDVDARGRRHRPETKEFDYLVEINSRKGGAFSIDEYRDGSVDPSIFPAGIATEGVPAMALIFHPAFAVDYAFSCEGLGRWGGRPAWQVHFSQRPDRPSRIREYEVRGMIYPLPLKGRAWIDAGTYEPLHLETDLIAPIESIKLTREHIAVTYGLVDFRTGGQEMWLPKTAEIYVNQSGRRYYRRHSFSKFQVYTVETAETDQLPNPFYCFTNVTDRTIEAVLNVATRLNAGSKPASTRFSIAPGANACKSIGVGKDLNMAPNDVESATLYFDGPPGAIHPDAFLTKESTLEIVPYSNVRKLP